MQELAKKELEALQKKSLALFGFNLHVTLSFDLKGTKVIGQCKQLTKQTYLIRLHKPLLEHYKQIYLNDVLTHEFAHAVQMFTCKSKVKPHGKE